LQLILQLQILELLLKINRKNKYTRLVIIKEGDKQ